MKAPLGPSGEARVRKGLNQPVGPLLGVDVATLNGIPFGDGDIVSLEGLQCATGLVSLRLFYNQIADIGPLAGLVKLEVLDLQNNPVADIGPLAGLTALRELDISGTDDPDLSPLAGLVALEELDIGGVPATTLAPLAGLTSLRELYASYSEHLDVEPLAGLTSIVWLDIAGNAVSDLGPLAGMTQLERLIISGTDVSDLGPLTGLPIRAFDAQNALIDDISPLATWPTPDYMMLENNQIVEADPLLASGWAFDAESPYCGDVFMWGNPLSVTALTQVIPAFCAASGGFVYADGLMACDGQTCIMP